MHFLVGASDRVGADAHERPLPDSDEVTAITRRRQRRSVPHPPHEMDIYAHIQAR
jgi:hypothetical protein